MAKQEAKEIGWMLKWALIIGFMGAIIGPIIFIQNHLHWKIADFNYYIFFFKELFSNPEYAEGLKEILQNPPQCLVHVSMQWHPHRP